MDPNGSSFQNEHINKSSQRIRKQNWTHDQTTLMLNLVREEQLAFRVGGPGTFNKQFWDRIGIALSTRSHPPREGNECVRRWKNIKQDFHEYKECVSKSGWGFNPDNCVPVAPDEQAWAELKQNGSKLYKCKDKPFYWFDIMDEIYGSKVAKGSRASSSKKGVAIQDLVSCSESSDSNRNASQELNDFDLHEFTKTVGVDLNFSFGDIGEDYPLHTSSEQCFGGANSGGAASDSSNKKRSMEESIGNDKEGASERKKWKGKGSSSNKNKEFTYNVAKMIVDESKERRNSFEEMKNMIVEMGKNGSKEVASKLLSVKCHREMSMREFLVLQDVLNGNDLMQALFLSMDGADLNEWIDECLKNYNSGK